MDEPAPLIAIAEAPAPGNGGAEWFEGGDGARLRAALFRPDGAPRGSAILSPGRTEPIEKYFEVIAELQARGFVVLVHDWRGQGFSARETADPLKGHAAGWRAFVKDFERLLNAFEARMPKPWIAFAHSMGAGLTLAAIVEGEPRIDAVLLTAPMLAIQTGKTSPALVRCVAMVMSLAGRADRYVWGQPSNLVEQRFDSNRLTHDRARWDRTQAQLHVSPQLQLGGVTWGWLAFALALGRRIARRAARIDLPMIIVAAGDDRLCRNEAARAVAARASNVRYVEVPGAFHELLMETDDVRARVWAEFDRLAERAAPSHPRDHPPHAVTHATSAVEEANARS